MTDESIIDKAMQKGDEKEMVKTLGEMEKAYDDTETEDQRELRFSRMIMDKNHEEFFDDGRFVPKQLGDFIKEGIVFKTIRESEEMYYYKKGMYRRGGEGKVKEMCSIILGDRFNQHRANETVFYIKTTTYIDSSEINENPNILNLKNGLLDIESMELLPHTPSMFITYQIPVSYVPGEKCDRIIKFLSEVLYKEDIPVVQEMVGYCLWKKYHIHKAFMLIGDGANGKSTLISLIKTFLGEKNICSISLQDLEGRFSSANLYGKLANLYPDLTDKSLYQTGKFKMTTGGDIIGAEVKFVKDRINFVNHAKMIFSTNKVPKTNDFTSAFYRRLEFVTFPNVFEGDKCDPNILEKLVTDNELSGMLNWAIGGLIRLLKNGQFSHSKSTDEVQDIYERLSSPVAAFVKDCVEKSPEDYIIKVALYEAFINYCKENGLPTTANNVFAKNMMEYCPNIRSEKVTHMGKKGRTAWRGIKLVFDKNRHTVIGIKDSKVISYIKTIQGSKNKIEKSPDSHDTPTPNVKNIKGIGGISDKLKEFVEKNGNEFSSQDLQEKLGLAKEEIEKARTDGIIFEHTPGRFRLT